MASCICHKAKQMMQVYAPLLTTDGTFIMLTLDCVTIVDGVDVRLQCPAYENIPDQLLCSLDGGDFFECKMCICNEVFPVSGKGPLH